MHCALALGIFPGLLGAETTSDEAGAAAPLTTASVHVIGEIPDGTPPPPAAPKPRLVFGPEDVIASRVKDLGSRKITFQKVAPMELPPIPVPVKNPHSEVDPERMAQAREHYQKRQFVFLGASAYVSKKNPDKPRTYVRMWPQRKNAEPIGIWINANFLYLTGFSEFEAGDTIYSLLMAISATEVDNPAAIAGKFLRTTETPEMPEFAEDGAASFVVVDGTPLEEDLAPIRALVAMYNRDKEPLKTAYLGRKALADQAARELAANPPEKKNLVLRYWRTDRAGQTRKSKPATIR